jgi:two-component system response regulator NreC
LNYSNIRERFISNFDVQSSPRKHPEQTDAYARLTPREREVLKLVAEGKTSAEIGRALGISPRTVEDHRAHLMRKLKLHNLADLVRYAIRRGIVPLD